MVNSPVLSAPVQRALPGAAVAGGSVQASHGWGAFGPSEGADQSAVSASRPFGPSEGADQATSWGFYSAGQPSEGSDQSGVRDSFTPSEG
jgi:hypothetical protein